MTARLAILRSLRPAAHKTALALLLILATALLLALPRPLAASEPARVQKICVADARTGEVESVLAQRDPAGILRRIDDGTTELKLDPRLEARHADWYRERRPIVWNGKTYRAGSEWRESALNRYLRHQGLYRGVPLMSLWPGGDRTLAVLVDQETCTFRRYEPEGTD